MSAHAQVRSGVGLPVGPHGNSVLRRKCACGTHTLAGGACAACAQNQVALQRKHAGTGEPGQRETERAGARVAGAGVAAPQVSSLLSERIQKDDAPKQKTDQEKYLEGLAKLGAAFLETPVGKQLVEKIEQDRLVRDAKAWGKDFISSWSGKLVTGAAATGAVAALAANHKELPLQIPELPLDVLTPGLSVQLTYKGPVDKPTEAMVVFKYSPRPARSGSAAPSPRALDKFRAETAAMAAADAKFRAGMVYPPGSPEDVRQKAEQEALKRAVSRLPGGPGSETTYQKYRWLGVPPTSGPAGGVQPSLRGDQFTPAGEQKKKPDDGAVQKKLSIGASADPLEQEADRVADQVVAGADRPAVSPARPAIARATAAGPAQADEAPASVERVLGGAGSALDAPLRSDMEARFGQDFSQVRVHLGDAAAQSARELDAHAYTVGQHIVFGAGTFAPASREGRHLLAHELTHVVQQSGAGRSGAAPGGVQRAPATTEAHTPAKPAGGGAGTLKGAPPSFGARIRTALFGW